MANLQRVHSSSRADGELSRLLGVEPGARLSKSETEALNQVDASWDDVQVQQCGMQICGRLSSNPFRRILRMSCATLLISTDSRIQLDDLQMNRCGVQTCGRLSSNPFRRILRMACATSLISKDSRIQLGCRDDLQMNRCGVQTCGRLSSNPFRRILRMSCATLLISNDSRIQPRF